MKKLSCCGLLLAALGCGGQTNIQPPQVAQQEPASVTAQPAGAPAATNGVVSNGAGTEPGEVVALFLDSLRRGDEITANGALTTQAQTELAKTDYVIEPLGTPEGKYTIGRVGYVDDEKTTGLVECMWSEPNPQAGQPPIEMELVCEVHKEKAGWRISGLAVKMAGTEDTFVLDFENATSLQTALKSADSQPTQPTQPAQPSTTPAGQADSVAQETAAQNTGATSPASPPAQIAMPPLPSASLPR